MDRKIPWRLGIRATASVIMGEDFHQQVLVNGYLSQFLRFSTRHLTDTFEAHYLISPGRKVAKISW